MTGKRFMAVALMTTLSLSFLGGCGQEETSPKEAQVQKEKEPAEVAPVSLEAWTGEWNSLEEYLNQPELKNIFARMAKASGENEEASFESYRKNHHADFKALAIKGHQVSFFDGKVGEGKAIAEGTYEFVKTLKPEEAGEPWVEFKAKKETAYPVLLLLPVEKEGLVHFHMRYGKDEKEALANKEWSPAFIKPNSTLEQIAEEIEE